MGRGKGGKKTKTKWFSVWTSSGGLSQALSPGSSVPSGNRFPPAHPERSSASTPARKGATHGESSQTSSQEAKRAESAVRRSNALGDFWAAMRNMAATKEELAKRRPKGGEKADVLICVPDNPKAEILYDVGAVLAQKVNRGEKVKVVRLSEANFSDLEDGGRVYVTGHGYAADRKIENINMKDFAEKLRAELGDSLLRGIFLRACESALHIDTQRGEMGSIGLDLMRYLRDADENPKRIPVQGATGEAITDAEGDVRALPTDFARLDPERFKEYSAEFRELDRDYDLLYKITVDVLKDPSLPLDVKAMFVYRAWSSYMQVTQAAMEKYLQPKDGSVKTYDPDDTTNNPPVKKPEQSAPIDWKAVDPSTASRAELHQAVKAAVAEIEGDASKTEAWEGSHAKEAWEYDLAYPSGELEKQGYEGFPGDPDFDVARWEESMRSLLAELKAI
jgi:hypothetical protein